MAQDDRTTISRRNLLMKLGLAAGAVYVAPTVAGLDVARASTGSGGGGRNGGGGRSSGSGRSSGPSRPGRSGGGRSSGPSRPGPANGRSSNTQWRWDRDRNRLVRTRISG
ncbi:hypothetical protein [Rhodovulum strictum]|uniref:Uncharacterized protein n=1 Tax=Rhodovulum strictum TaxID=58314 RepID=A0A844B5Z5_9RHOB|nr:hypothetical protein [Rhodovulum strictum]MRH21796.1 hypothetical protein [Rhodovulum strictum]